MAANNKKRLWIINHHASTPSVGLSASRHYDLLVEMGKRGYDTTIFASSFSHQSKRYYFKDDIYIENFECGGRCVWIKSRPEYRNIMQRFLNYIDFYRKIKKIYVQFGLPDIVIGSSVHPLAWEAAYYISRKTGAAFITEIRDIWPFSIKETLGNKYYILSALMRPLEKHAYGESDKIVTTMPYAYEYIEECGYPKEKVIWIPHSVDVEQLDIFRKENIDNIPKPIDEILTNKKCCVYTGAISPAEGLHALIRAAQIIRDKGSKVEIIIIGDGSDKERLQKIIKENSINNVHMFGKISRQIVQSALSKAYMLFCGLIDKEAYIRYGISKNKFYDYFAARKPVIFASNVRDSIIDKANAGYTVESENANAIADAIISIEQADLEVYNSFGRNAREYVEKHNTNIIMANKFESVFNEVLSKRCGK